MPFVIGILKTSQPSSTQEPMWCCATGTKHESWNAQQKVDSTLTRPKWEDFFLSQFQTSHIPLKVTLSVITYIKRVKVHFSLLGEKGLKQTSL
jgi:hypothetical protein